MSTVFVKPIEGAVVRDPVTRAALPEAGGEVSLDTYWRRRINDGTVVVVPREAEQSKQETTETAEPTGTIKTGRRN